MVAKIELKEGSVSKKVRPFRLPQEREEALKGMILAFQEKEWLEP